MHFKKMYEPYETVLGNENGIDVVDDSEPPALAYTQSDREEEAALESDTRLNEG